MKKLTFIVLFITAGFILPAQTFVSTTPTNKNVIIENFTQEHLGAPEGDVIINRLIANNPNRVFGINLYDYAFSYDFTCEDGLTLFNYFTPWQYDDFTPATVNRGSIVNMEYLENLVNTTLSQASCLNVAAQGSIDWDLRQLTLTVEVYYTDNSNTSENYLTLALLQNNLEGEEPGGSYFNPAQALPNGKYNHLYVLRDIIGETWGDTIATTTQGSFFTKTYIYNIPDTIESKLPTYLKERTLRPNVLLEDLDVIVFVSESKKTIISGAKAEITHEHVPEINIYAALDNIYELHAECGSDFPLYLTLKNSGSDTIHSVEYNILKDGQPFLQNQLWDIRPIYPFTTDTIALENIPMSGGIESLISIEITQINETDTTIAIEKAFTRHLVEDARGKMTLIIAPDQWAGSIYFRFYGADNQELLGNWDNPWSNLSSPGIRVYSYDIYPDAVGCYLFHITDNLNKGYGEGYFKLLAADGSVLIDNDGKNCKDIWYYINVTEPYTSAINDIAKETISVFPNPAQSHFTVTNTENANLTLYNILGQQVKQVIGDGENTIIYTEDLPQGIYLLKVEKEGAVLTKKIQISN